MYEKSAKANYFSQTLKVSYFFKISVSLLEASG